MSDELNVDQIVAEVESSRNSEIPMENTPPEAEASGPTPTADEFEYQADGKPWKVNREKLLELASKGHTSGRAIGRLQKQIEDYQGRFKQYEAWEKDYRPIDEWASKNPEAWKRFFSSWQQAQFGANGQPQNPEAAAQAKAQLPPELIQELQASREFREQQIQEKQAIRTERADHNLDQQIKTLRDEFPHIDFDAPDETGNSLEYRVLEFATKNGIPDFEAAFWKLQGRSLMNRAGEGSRGSIPQKTKAGLLGKDPAPNRGKPVSELIKNRNYDQIHELVMSDLARGAI